MEKGQAVRIFGSEKVESGILLEKVNSCEWRVDTCTLDKGIVRVEECQLERIGKKLAEQEKKREKDLDINDIPDDLTEGSNQ